MQSQTGEEIRFGRYVLTRKLAHGGMAEVFLGRAANADPDAPAVVIKRILPELMHDERFVAMFVNEAQLAAQMSHENLVKVLDFGEVGGRLYMAMEFVDGLDCWRFSRRMHPWGDNHVGLAVHVMRRALAGLDYAHRLEDVNGRPMRVVHRDFSPSNIYLSVEGEVKLGDFGIARIDSPHYSPIEIIPRGKFGYMAPEQVEGREVDARSDVFSAGVVLAEIVIGRRLFQGNSQLSVMLDIRDGRLDILEQNAARIPKLLLEILYRALARDPRDRFGSAGELERILAAFQSETGNIATAAELGEEVRRAALLKDPRSTASDLRRAPSTPVTAAPDPSFPDARLEPGAPGALGEGSSGATPAQLTVTKGASARAEWAWM